MSITFKCGVCGTTVQAADADAGGTRTCKACGELIRVPRAKPSSPRRSAHRVAPLMPSLLRSASRVASLISCPDCGHGISTQAAACPQCGAPTKHKQKQTTLRTFALGLVMLTFVVVCVPVCLVVMSLSDISSPTHVGRTTRAEARTACSYMTDNEFEEMIAVMQEGKAEGKPYDEVTIGGVVLVLCDSVDDPRECGDCFRTIYDYVHER